MIDKVENSQKIVLIIGYVYQFCTIYEILMRYPLYLYTSM